MVVAVIEFLKQGYLKYGRLLFPLALQPSVGYGLLVHEVS
jgi:hypothetical protein